MASMGMVGAAAAVVAKRMEEERKKREAEKKKLPGVTYKGMLDELQALPPSEEKKAY